MFIVALAALVDSQAEGCSPGQVRLQKGTNYAGEVEICWSERSLEQYRWQPLCSNNDRWTESEAGAVCKALGISTAYSGKPFMQGLVKLVQLR